MLIRFHVLIMSLISPSYLTFPISKNEHWCSLYNFVFRFLFFSFFMKITLKYSVCKLMSLCEMLWNVEKPISLFHIQRPTVQYFHRARVCVVFPVHSCTALAFVWPYKRQIQLYLSFISLAVCFGPGATV